MKKTPLRRKKGLKRTKSRGSVVARVLGRSTGVSRASKKKTTITKLKKRLWELCKQIIRGKYGNVCFTCGKRDLEGSNWHTGHFIPSSVCSVEMRYSLDNLRPCCYHCNINLSGNWVAYEKHLRADGFDTEKMKQYNEETKGLQYDSLWYERKIAEYKKL